MTAPLHAGRRAGLLRAAELPAPHRLSVLAQGGHHLTLVEKQARGLLPAAA